MTFHWPATTPLRVTTDKMGAPLRFWWQGYGYPVEEVLNRWRSDEDWWRKRVWREYFKVVTTTGLLVVLYRDLLTGKWYLQSLYD